MATSKKTQTHGDLVEWFTVSYRTIYLAVGGLVLAAGLVYYFVFARAQRAPAETPAPPISVTAARFRSLEGNVRVKPVGQFEWIPADSNMILRKSDLVRTGPGAAAEIAFFDGTVVHVRPDSLITIEETSEDPSTKRRKVAWHISSGEVNFQTVRRNVPGGAAEISTPTVRPPRLAPASRTSCTPVPVATSSTSSPGRTLASSSTRRRAVDSVARAHPSYTGASRV